MTSTTQHLSQTEGQRSNYPYLFDTVTSDEQVNIQHSFVDHISHELRTPLSNIKLYLSLLENSTPTNRARYIETIKREADRLQNITDDMLMLSQFDTGQIEPYFEPVELEKLLQDSVTAHKKLALSHGVVLTYGTVCNALSTNLPPFETDTLLLKEILQQLITNAIVYTCAGGTVTVEAAPRVENEQPWCAISVRDTGVGVDPSETERIFERSYRGGSSFELEIAGTGLGLTICQAAAQSLGGSIKVESAPSVGSTFTLLLPI